MKIFYAAYKATLNKEKEYFEPPMTIGKLSV